MSDSVRHDPASSLLRNRNFLLFWSTQFVSLFATSYYMIVLPLWIYRATGSYLHVGAVATVGSVVFILFSIYAGVFVDRHDKRRILVASDLIRAVLVLPMLLVTSVDSIYVAYIAAAATGAATAFFVPSQNHLITAVAGSGGLRRANALLHFSYSATLVIGPIVGGLAVTGFGYQISFFANALSFVIGALGSFLVTLPVEPPAPAGRRPSFVDDALAGFRFVIRDGVLRPVMISQAIVFIGSGANATLFVLHLRSIGPAGIGIYMSAQGAGMLVASTVLSLGDRGEKASVRAIAYCGLALGVTLATFAWLTPQHLVVGTATIFTFGIALTVYGVETRTALQAFSPKELLGRVTAVATLISRGGAAVSILMGSALAAAVQPKGAIICCGVMIFAGFVLLLFGTRTPVTPEMRLSSAGS